MNGHDAPEHKPVWSKRTGGMPSEINIIYTAGRDVKAKPAADELLIPYDIWTNRAHCLMLHKQRIISPDIARKILGSLEKISSLYLKNQFHLDPHLEDVHINIETFIAEDVGEEVAGWLHTARSRNDQSTTDVRLYVRDCLLQKIEGCQDLLECLIEEAGRYRDAIMPGLTHLRFASLTTWAHYLLSYAAALERDLSRLERAYDMINQSPLGAVASYGTSWNIDRQYTAQLLGFNRIQTNTIDCLTNRWEFEAEAAVAMAFLMNHVSIMCEDLLIFSLPTMEMVEIDDRFVTGSSVMPQKQNFDYAEVIRAKASLIHGMVQALWGIGKGVTSGYNRDEQWTKFIIIDIFDEARYSTRLLRDIISSLKIKRPAMAAIAEKGFLNAVEAADFVAQRYALPFRTAYRAMANAVKQSSAEGILSLENVNLSLQEEGLRIKITKKEWSQIVNLQEIIKKKKHNGACAPEAIDEHRLSLSSVLEQHKKWFTDNTRLLNRSKRFLKEQIKAILVV